MGTVTAHNSLNLSKTDHWCCIVVVVRCQSWHFV